MVFALGAQLPCDLVGIDQKQNPVVITPSIPGKWAVVFSYPADFTPICSSEVLEFARAYEDFTKRSCRLIGISTNSSESHSRWIHHLEATYALKINFSLMADESGELLEKLRFLDTPLSEVSSEEDRRKSALQSRNLYIVDPLGKVMFLQSVGSSVGRSVSEVLRVLDSLQLSALEKKLGTPEGWKFGEEPVVLRRDEAKKERRHTGIFSSVKFLRLSEEPFAD